MNWKDMKIGHKITLCFFVPLFMLAVVGYWSFHVSNQISTHAAKTHDQSGKSLALVAERMSKDILQIQQWLTDISATRGLNGLDDGFDEAENSYQSYMEGWRQFETVYVNENNEAGLGTLQDLKVRLDAYYAMGKKMANAYISGGPEIGNKMMGEFDETAANISAAMTPFVQEQSDIMGEMLAGIVTSLAGLKRVIVIACLASLLMITAAGLFLTRSVTRSLVKGMNVAKALSEGDLTIDVDVDGHDETGQMLSAMKTMVENQRQIAQRLIDATSTVASSSEETSTTVLQISTGFEKQSSDIEQTATASTELSQTIIDIAKNTADAAETTKESVGFAAEGEEAVEATLAGMTEIAKTVADTAIMIGQLGESSHQIGDIINVIEDIADQTNLLALNAAIEAARAGEKGRGFSVVAEEVRKLAEKTGSATAEISMMIKKIQDDTSSSIKSIENGKKTVQGGVVLAEKAKASLVSIVKSSERCHDMIQMVATATEEQSVVVEQVSTNMESISNVSKSSKEAITTINKATMDLSKLANDLKSTAEWFKAG